MKFGFEIEVLEKSHEQRREFKYTSLWCITYWQRRSSIAGGNIFFDDLHVEYESGLNEPINERIGTESDDLRIVTDLDIIERIDNVLKSWVVGL